MQQYTSNTADTLEDAIKRLIFIREETRFEIVLLHERINALIGAEAFLTIAFAASMNNTNVRWGALFSVIVAPMLSVIGLLLAVLAWPGVNASFKIVLQWNSRQLRLFQEHPELAEALWRPHVQGHRDPSQYHTMLFARAVPLVFSALWLALTVVALVLPLRA